MGVVIHYTLSNRQRKELDRGAQLRLAIPVGPEWRDDWPGGEMTSDRARIDQ